MSMPVIALEQLAREMNGRAVAGRGVVELAGIGLGVGDQVLHRIDFGSCFFTTRMFGRLATCAIGMRSFSGSKASLA